MLDYLETELTYPEFQLLLPIPRVLDIERILN